MSETCEKEACASGQSNRADSASHPIDANSGPTCLLCPGDFVSYLNEQRAAGLIRRRPHLSADHSPARVTNLGQLVPRPRPMIRGQRRRRLRRASPYTRHERKSPRHCAGGRTARRVRAYSRVRRSRARRAPQPRGTARGEVREPGAKAKLCLDERRINAMEHDGTA